MHTERLRFLPVLPPTDATAAILPLKLALQTEEPFPQVRWRGDACYFTYIKLTGCPIFPTLQHLAYEDLCFLAEKDSARLAAVFDDQTGACWTALVKAALKPVDAVAAAAATLGGGAATQDMRSASAARELRCVRRCCPCMAPVATCA